MDRSPRDGGSRPNPWQQKRGGGSSAPGAGGGSKKGSAKKHGGSKTSGNTKNNHVDEKHSLTKFEEARSKMEQAVKKHFVSDYQSSDEEDDIQVDPIVGKSDFGNFFTTLVSAFSCMSSYLVTYYYYVENFT